MPKLILIILSVCLSILFLNIYTNGQDKRKAVMMVPAISNNVEKGITNGVNNTVRENMRKSVEYKQLTPNNTFLNSLGEVSLRHGGSSAVKHLADLSKEQDAFFAFYILIDRITSNIYEINYKLIDVFSYETITEGNERVSNGAGGLIETTGNIIKRVFCTVEEKTEAETHNFQNGDTYNPDGIELVFVKGSGGSGKSDIKDFFIGKYEVTQAQWREIMGSNLSSNRGDNHPVENVSWKDAQEFISLLNQKTGRKYRLPSEAEWEFAGKGGIQSKGFIYSGSNIIDDVAWYHENSNGSSQPVGTKAPNELGIYDMSGNVVEWCNDCNTSECTGRILRGGGWLNPSERCLLDSRQSQGPDYRYSNIGFRVAVY